MFGPMTDFVRPGILVGAPPQVIERIGSTRRPGRNGSSWHSGPPSTGKASSSSFRK